VVAERVEGGADLVAIGGKGAAPPADLPDMPLEVRQVTTSVAKVSHTDASFLFPPELARERAVLELDTSTALDLSGLDGTSIAKASHGDARA